MKLQSSLRVRGTLPVMTGAVTVVLLLVFFILLSTSFLLQPGIAVELPPSRFLQPASQDPLVVAVTADPGSAIYFEDRKVELDHLAARLEARRGASGQVIVKADRMAPLALVTGVTELALSQGFSVSLAASRP